MDKIAVDSVVTSLEKLEYTDKFNVYKRIFSLGNLDGDLNEKLILISLIALVWFKLKEKNPQITPLDILMKLTGQIKDNSGYYQFLESLSIIVEDMSYDCKAFDACGLKTSQEIFNKIKEILSTWIPF